MNKDQSTQRMDSGDPQTLISFCKWAISHYPAKIMPLFFGTTDQEL